MMSILYCKYYFRHYFQSTFFLFDVLSLSAFITFDLFSFRNYLLFDVLSFLRFSPYDLFSVDVSVDVFTVKVFYFYVLTDVDFKLKALTF